MAVYLAPHPSPPLSPVPLLDVSVVFVSVETELLSVEAADVSGVDEFVPEVVLVEVSLGDALVVCGAVLVGKVLLTEEVELGSVCAVDAELVLLVVLLPLEVDVFVAPEVAVSVPEGEGAGFEPDDSPHASKTLDAANATHNESVFCDTLFAEAGLIELLTRWRSDARDSPAEVGFERQNFNIFKQSSVG